MPLPSLWLGIYKIYNLHVARLMLTISGYTKELLSVMLFLENLRDKYYSLMYVLFCIV